MASISIGHLMHTDRPLIWRSQPSCPRCMLPYTGHTSAAPVQRVAFLLDCQHLLCGQCCQEHMLDKHIICEICKRRMDLPEDRDNVTEVLHPSLFVLGVLQQAQLEMANVDAYWQSDVETSPARDLTKCPTGERLPDSDIESPTQLLSLLEKAYDAYDKSKTNLTKQSKLQRENVGSVVEQVNTHFIAFHNALQIEENRVLQKVRTAYIERCQQIKSEQNQLKAVKDRLKDLIQRAKTFRNDSVKKALDSDSSWRHLSTEVKQFLQNEPIKLESDVKKLLHAPLHYQPREVHFKDVQSYHKLKIEEQQCEARLVPMTYRGYSKAPESAQKSSFLSKLKEGEKSSGSSKKQSTSGRRGEERARDRSKESAKYRKADVKQKSHESSVERFGECSSATARSKAPAPAKVKDHSPKKTAWEKALARKQSASTKAAETPSESGKKNESIASAVSSERSASRRHSSSNDSSMRQSATDGDLKRRTVNVTCVISPREFYVQDELFTEQAASTLSELCSVDAEAYDGPLMAGKTLSIEAGAMYLVRPESYTDPRWVTRWYRAEVLAVHEPANGLHLVQYIDFGPKDTVRQDQIRPLSAELAASAPKMTRCALYELQPAQKSHQWTDECRQLMMDFIGNKPMIMCELATTADQTLLVDLLLTPAIAPGKARHVGSKNQSDQRWHGRYAPMSLRSALIYLSLAEPAKEIFHQQEDARLYLVRKLIGKHQRWLEVATTLTHRFMDIPRQPVLQEHDHFECTITQVNSIEHFHLMPTEWKSTALGPLERHLDTVCRQPSASKVYCPYVGLVCAFARHGKEGETLWLRGRVLRLLRKRCMLFALDTGDVQETLWSDMRLLPPDDPAHFKHPLAVRCSLGHIRPKRTSPGMRWTQEAFDEFQQIACSGTLRFAVSLGGFEPVNGGVYSVVLFLVNKRDRDTCVNGLLVRNGHAECVGPEENVQDRLRELDLGEFASQSADKMVDSKPETSTVGGGAVVRVTDPRLPVVLLQVVSPGEFYVMLCVQQAGLEQLHQTIQEHMDDRIDEEEGEPDGGDAKAAGDVCVVFARVNEGDAREWHRARIETVLDDGVHYDAFLIDRAVRAKVHRTNVARLTARMAQIQPGAIRCRLACISPIGGSTTWHQSSLDAFRDVIGAYAQHAISLDAIPASDATDRSLPVVLWGVRTVDRDALAPTRTVYNNLNQTLAKVGLAHLSGRFRTFATSGTGAAEEHQLLEDAIGVQLRAEYEQIEQFFRAVAAVQCGEQGPTATVGGGPDGTVRDGSKTAENVLSERDDWWMDATNRTALRQMTPTVDGKPVTAWPPAVPLEKSIFVGVPTYVGSDGIVYLHDVCQEPVLDRIRSAIQTHVASPVPDDGPKDAKPFVVGNPCLARFHLDGQFYRATVTQELAQDRFMVLFVDYGNVEECPGEDLQPATVCGLVPVQTILVRLSGIVPSETKKAQSTDRKNRQQKKKSFVSRNWPEVALDACHSLIVQKRCSIRINPGEGTSAGVAYDEKHVPYCSMQLIDVGDGVGADVAEVLVALGLFVPESSRRPVANRPFWPVSPVQTTPVPNDDRMLDEPAPIMYPPPGTLPVTITPEDQELKRWFENIQSQLETTQSGNRIEVEDPNEWDCDDSQGPLNRAQLIHAIEPIDQVDEDEQGSSGPSDGLRTVTLEIADASPMPSPAMLNSEEFETSSRFSDGAASPHGNESVPDGEFLHEGRISNPLFRSFPVLPRPEHSMRGFFAEYTNYGQDLTLYVYPHLEGHTRRIATVAQQVQKCARSNNELHLWQASLLEPGAPCLAPYREDGLYYRAIVETRDEEQRVANVLYVDYLNRETVPLADLRKCPITLQRSTLRNIPVRLAGVRTNPRLRDSDVVCRLSNLLERPFFVMLIGQHSPRADDATVLPVELYTDADCQTLVYQTMIDEKYFLPLR